jgi:hypothetical protein
MVLPSRRRKGSIVANIVNRTSNFCKNRSILEFCIFGIIALFLWIAFYTKVDTLIRYDDRINEIALVTDVVDESVVKGPINANEYYPKLDIDVTEQEINESFDYINRFTEKSFQRPLAFFHIPKNAGTAIEHAAGISNRSLSWGSCMFNHGRKRLDCTYPSGGECKVKRF